MWKLISHLFMNLDTRSISRLWNSVNLQFPTFRNRRSFSSSPTGWPQPSVTNCSMLLNILERRRRRLQGGGNLKSRNLDIFILTMTYIILRVYRLYSQCNNFQSCWDIHRHSWNKFGYSVPYVCITGLGCLKLSYVSSLKLCYFSLTWFVSWNLLCLIWNICFVSWESLV